jgi:transposase
MGKFHSIDRNTDFLLPPSVQEWLPEDHLARYVVEVVENLGLSDLERAYAGKGSAAYHPAVLLSLLIYGYATGCFSTRKIERATYESLAFRFIACNRHPDHDTLATFRVRFRKEFEAVFVEVLQVARENRLSRFGSVSLDGTKIHANASRHSAQISGYAEAIEAQLKAEVQELLALGEAADGANVPDGMRIPDELKRREVRLAAIAEAKGKIEVRAAERYAREQTDYEAKLAARAAKDASGKKPRGKEPEAPQPGPRPGEQINLTDAESRIMVVPGGGFDQCYNAQAVVDTDTLLVLVPQVTQAPNDKEQVAPMIEKVQALPEGLNRPRKLAADAGYFSAENVDTCEAAGIEPLIAVKRDQHHLPVCARFEEPPEVGSEANPVQRMVRNLKTKAGRAAYALRKQTVEPVFGIIKSVMGFRQFLTRGLDKVQGEWTLVCLAWNLKRMAVLRPQ